MYLVQLMKKNITIEVNVPGLGQEDHVVPVSEISGVVGYMLVYDTLDDALAAAGGDASLIKAMAVRTKEDSQ